VTASWYEVEGSPQENGSREQFTATMQVRCAWDDRIDVMSYWGSITSPVVYPHIPETLAIVESLSCQPHGTKITASGQLAGYDSALITINFSNKVDSETMSVETIEPMCEYAPLDASLFEWTDGSDVKDAEAPGLLQQSLVYELEYPAAQRVPTGYLSATGCCNLASWSTLTLGLTFGAETLLYTPKRCTRVLKTDGFEAFSLGMAFTYRATGWNTFWRHSSASYEQIKLKNGAVYKSYPPCDFNTLRL
jgi:hypothetical protein